MNNFHQINCKDGKHWTTNDVCYFIESIFIEKGEYIIISGNIHNDIGLINRYPMVCGAMKRLMKKYQYEIIDNHTQSEETSTFTIKYIVE